MKNILFITALLLTSTSIFAQTYTAKEIGISRQGVLFGDFGFTYRQQKADNKFRRFEVVAHNTSIFNPINLQSGFTFQTGMEKRKTLQNEKWQYCKGWMFGLGISNLDAKDFGNSSVYITPKIGYAFGWQYAINEKISARVEITPTLGQNIQLSPNQQAADRGLSLSAPVTLSFCWKK
jgi:hypothetical protein